MALSLSLFENNLIALFPVLPHGTKSGLSTGAIVGVVMAAFAAAAILSSIITIVILRRRSKHSSSKKRSGKPSAYALYGLK